MVTSNNVCLWLEQNFNCAPLRTAKVPPVPFPLSLSLFSPPSFDLFLRTVFLPEWCCCILTQISYQPLHQQQSPTIIRKTQFQQSLFLLQLETMQRSDVMQFTQPRSLVRNSLQVFIHLSSKTGADHLRWRKMKCCSLSLQNVLDPVFNLDFQYNRAPAFTFQLAASILHFSCSSCMQMLTQ